MSQPEVFVTTKNVLLETLLNLGLIINWDKSSLTPEFVKDYIGYSINSRGPDNVPWIKIPARRISKLNRDIKRVLSGGYVKARFLARICGQCISFTKAILPTKLLLRDLYRLLRSRSSWSDVLKLNDASIKELNWWLSAMHSWNGRPIVKRSVDLQISTDASASGWGAVCGSYEASGLWNANQAFRHSNYRELLTVLLAIKSFKGFIAGKTVQILSDNIVTVAYVNHLGGPCQDLSNLAKSIWSEAFQLDTVIIAKYLAGCQNTAADRLSRLSPHSTYSWSLHPGIFNFLDHRWGPHSCDRFADITNHLCPMYNSLYHDPLSSGVDALAQNDWSRHNNFVNPPFKLIPRILDVIIKQKAEATVIAPWWPAQPWFHTLVRLSIQPPFALPKSRLMWYRGKRPEPLKNPRWRIMAWRISGKRP